MKKIISSILCIFLLFSIAGCGGNKKYEPKVEAKYGEVYRSKNNKESDGQYALINISNIEKKDGNIIVSVGGPTQQQIIYAFDNYLFVDLKNEKGDNFKFDEIKLKTKNLDSDAECEIWLTNVKDIDTVKYVEVGPYKTEDNNPVVFKISE